MGWGRWGEDRPLNFLVDSTLSKLIETVWVIWNFKSCISGLNWEFDRHGGHQRSYLQSAIEQRIPNTLIVGKVSPTSHTPLFNGRGADVAQASLDKTTIIHCPFTTYNVVHLLYRFDNQYQQHQCDNKGVIFKVVSKSPFMASFDPLWTQYPTSPLLEQNREYRLKYKY